MASGDMNNKSLHALLGKAHFAVLIALAALLATQIGCLQPAGMTRETEADAAPEAAPDTAPDTAAEPLLTDDEAKALQAKVAALERQVADAQAATGEARTVAEQARADTVAAQDEAATIKAEFKAAIADAEAAAASMQDKVDMMMAAAHRPSEVRIAADRIDPSLLNLDAARASLAGPESIYVSSIRYGGETYSALLRYRGGTTATVERIFGSSGKLIPDSVDLSHTELALAAPDTLEVAFVGVGGRGYSGQLRYAGDNRLEVVGIRQVTLPPTAEELVAAAEAEAAAAVAAARADAEASVASAEARLAVAEAAVTDAETRLAVAEATVTDAETRLAAVEAESAAALAALAGAQDKVDMMVAEAHRPSAVMIAAGQIDPSLLNLDAAQVYLAGPESIYVSSIRYGGETYSALLRYRGGTTATVERIFGSSGKLIPDSVDLSHTELTLIAPDILDVAYVGIGGGGFSGKLRYAGDNRLEVVDIRQVALPATAEQLVAAAEARAAAGLAEARAAVANVEAKAADAIADARAAADDAVAEAEARLAAVEAQSAGAIADAQAALAGAQEKIDTMEAEGYRPSAVMVSADRIDPVLLNLDGARVSLAGPESIYVSGITYGDDTYSALLRYRGGTTATVDKVFGPTGKLIPDSVDLSHTELSMDGAILDVANVGVGGKGYSGQLRHVGGNRFEVVGLHPARPAAHSRRAGRRSTRRRRGRGCRSGGRRCCCRGGGCRGGGRRRRCRGRGCRGRGAARRGRSRGRGRDCRSAGRSGQRSGHGRHAAGRSIPAERRDGVRRTDRSQSTQSRRRSGVACRAGVDLRLVDQLRGRYLLGVAALSRRNHGNGREYLRTDRQADPRLGRSVAH